MTLKERLKPVHKVRLEHLGNEYPTMQGKINEALTNKYVIDITVGQALDIMMYLDVETVAELFNIFDDITVQV